MDFKERLKKHYGFTEKDWVGPVSRFEFTTLPVKSHFLESDEIANSLGYLRRGLMRSYFYDDQDKHAYDVG
jgi:hypothetical protein